MYRVKQWNRGSVAHRFADRIFTCVCVQFAVVGLLGGVEMFLDQEGARHGGGGRARADNGPGGGPTASRRLRCGGGQAGASEVTGLPARLSSSGLGGFSPWLLLEASNHSREVRISAPPCGTAVNRGRICCQTKLFWFKMGCSRHFSGGLKYIKCFQRENFGS